MKIYADCIVCNQRQVLDALFLIGAGEDKALEVMQAVARAMADLPRDTTPARSTSIAHRIMRQMTGSEDPYCQIKARHTAVAVSLYPELKALVREAEDPLLMALYVAIAGNIIDLATSAELDVRAEVKKILYKRLVVDHYAHFRKDASGAKSILYLGDNAGEVVFDRVLVEELGPEKVTYVVKGSPVLNDATLEDAKSAGMDEVCRVITTGDDSVGVEFDRASKHFLRAYEEADIVLSKGQANFESLSEVDKEVYFLLQAKCTAVPRELRVPRWSLILKKRGHTERSV